MGAGHVKMAGALWLAGCAVADLLGADPGAEVVVIGGAVCAGAALWNDIDHEDSTVSHSAGPLSRLLSHATVLLARQVYVTTRTVFDQPNRSPHRTLTHTWPWALTCGLAVSTVAHAAPLWVTTVLVFAACHLGIRTALPWGWRWWRPSTAGLWKWLFGRRWRRWKVLPRRLRISVPVLAGGALAAATWRWADGGDWWIGVAVAAGMLMPNAGDSLTNSAVSWSWPLTYRGQRWYRSGLPRRWRFDTGGDVELYRVQPAFVALGVVGAAVLLWPLGAAAAEVIGGGR